VPEPTPDTPKTTASAETPEPAKPEDELPTDPTFDDEVTQRAVEDIVAHESDKVLEAEDEAAARANPVPVRRRGFWRTIGHGFKLWLGTAKGRWITFILLVVAAGSVAAAPEARYYALNTAGVRAGAAVTVVDDITKLPLAGVPVQVAGQTKKTGEDGRVRFTQLRLGPAKVIIDRPGFARVERKVTLGWGSNPFGAIALDATGVRYTIAVTDFLSGAALEGVLATSENDDSTALSDEKGMIELTLEDAAPDAGVAVTLSKDGYRSEQVTLKALKQTTNAKLLTSRKAVYVSKASGRYDVYKTDIDGLNKQVILPGTGFENGNLALATSMDGSHAVLVSTRENKPDADGFLRYTLTLVNVESGTSVSLGSADQIQLIDWIGTRLIFEQVSTDPKVAAASRYTLVSYDYASNSRVQLAAAPKLTSVISAQGIVHYAIAADENNGSIKPGFYRINPDGSNRQTAYPHEVWGGLRTDYNTVSLQTQDGWVTYGINTGSTAEVASPASFTSRLYRDNAEHSRSLWVNQGALFTYEVNGAKDTMAQSQAGLGYPVYWMGNTAVYRVVTGSETADYITALVPGAQPHKIADVTNTFGFSAGQ
jgi:hypothetical protein